MQAIIIGYGFKLTLPLLILFTVLVLLFVYLFFALFFPEKFI